jgi:hypothetical protein
LLAASAVQALVDAVAGMLAPAVELVEAPVVVLPAELVLKFGVVLVAVGVPEGVVAALSASTAAVSHAERLNVATRQLGEVAASPLGQRGTVARSASTRAADSSAALRLS